jgi:small GTP-binding protein
MQYRANLVFVGEGAVGKTCTLNRLRNLNFSVTEETTHGIDIDEWELAYPQDKSLTMRLLTWDFGGQQIYNATHQFFLTRRSVYILCWNARQDTDQCRIDYWLRTINSLAPDSPVLLVATHTDERSPDINFSKFREKYPQLKGNFAVSNKTGEGISQLRTAIQEFASGLPQMGEPWPKSWVDARRKLDKKKEDDHHIGRKEFIQICNDHGIENKEIWDFASMLHDLGNILFFHEDSGLDDMVILQPEWITKAISKVLENEDTSIAKGVLNHEWLVNIWSDYNRKLHPAFLRLMEKFDLSYRIEGEKSSVVAQLLPFEPPEFDWPEPAQLPANESQLAMNFKLSFVPAGVMTWFIVRTHRFTMDKHWRDGVYFEHEGHRARLILNRLPGLRVVRAMPCICHEVKQVDKRCDYQFSYENLTNRVEAGKDSAECQITYTDIPINWILYGIHQSTFEGFKDELMNEIMQIGGGVSGLSIKFDQMADLLTRNFYRIHNTELAKLEADCPSMLTLEPSESRILNKSNMFTTHYDVHLWCQMPGCTHPVAEGWYELKQSKDWLIKLKPWLSTLVQTLQYVIPAAGAVAQGFATDAIWRSVSDKYEAMSKLVGLLPDVGEKIEEHDLPRDELTAASAGGADIRIIYELLHHLDSSHKWGGLRKTTSPEGDILWLCPTHYKTFDPGLPDLG